MKKKKYAITQLPNCIKYSTNQNKLIMGVYEITKDHVKQWVVRYSKVNNPHKKYWSAAVTIGYDYYGKGDTIEQAYNDMVTQIFTSPYIMSQLKDIKSFVEIVKQK